MKCWHFHKICKIKSFLPSQKQGNNVLLGKCCPPYSCQVHHSMVVPFKCLISSLVRNEWQNPTITYLQVSVTSHMVPTFLILPGEYKTTRQTTKLFKQQLSQGFYEIESKTEWHQTRVREGLLVLSWGATLQHLCSANITPMWRGDVRWTRILQQQQRKGENLIPCHSAVSGLMKWQEDFSA